MRISERQINILLGGALLALFPLAWLQYQWISEVSEADRQRRTIELRAGLERIAAESDRAAGEVHLHLIGPDEGGPVSLESRILDYRPSAEALPLNRILRLQPEEAGAWSATAWNPETKRMEPAPVPPWWTGAPYRQGPIHANPAALIGPDFTSRSDPPGFIVVELDEAKIAAEYLPRLVRRQFGEAADSQYDIRLATGAPSTPADAAVSIFRRIPRGDLPPPGRGFPKRKGKQGRGAGRPPGSEAVGPGIWRVEARHLQGSLEVVVSRSRTRNLIVSTVTLLFLALALLAVGFALRRAQRLARLQLEFTAGVSHEFRTPLAVIVAAGDNLAGGYVKDAPKVRDYGALVRDEGTRLTAMVDQVLRFAEFESDRMPIQKRSIPVAKVLENVEREMRPVADRQGCEWECQGAGATLVADAEALHVAVRNLVENALRHGGGKWLRLQAQETGEGVIFTVEDRGPGIAASDLPHLFDPFYRGAESRAQQRKGSGLGLALVDRIARAHGGSATAGNRTEGGARFTITIPHE